MLIYLTKTHQVPAMCTPMYRRPKTALVPKFLWGSRRVIRVLQASWPIPQKGRDFPERAVWEKNPGLHRPPTPFPFRNQGPQEAHILQHTPCSPRGRPGNLHCLNTRGKFKTGVKSQQALLAKIPKPHSPIHTWNLLIPLTPCFSLGMECVCERSYSLDVLKPQNNSNNSLLCRHCSQLDLGYHTS